MHPFTGVATREDGAVKICCRSHPIGWIQDDTLENIWNNENMRNVRKQVLNNEMPEVCSPCFDLESQGVESLRQRHIKTNLPDTRMSLYPNSLNLLNEDYAMPFEFPSIEIKLNNLCNLKCRMCNPLDSTNWKDWDNVVPFYKKENNYLVPTIEKLVKVPGQYIGSFDDTNNWWDSFEKLIPHLQRVEFAGGEPLMDPQHYRILDMLKPYGEHIQLKYATNGTTLGISQNRTIHDYWPHFKSIIVNVSIDGIHDVYNYIRTNGDFTELEKNIKEIKSIPNVSRVVGAFTLQATNALQIADCIDYFINEMGIYFFSHRVSYPTCLSAQVLPSKLKDEVVRKLIDMSFRVPRFKNVVANSLMHDITKQQIQENINYIWAKDQHHLWNDFVEFNKNLDITRNQGPLESIIKEFKPYV